MLINRALRFTPLILLIALGACSSEPAETPSVSDGVHKPDSAQPDLFNQDSLNTIIEQIESERFLGCMGVASVIEHGIEILKSQDEFKYIVETRTRSLPILRARYSDKAVIADHERITYFTIFGLCQDTLMFSEIVDYLRYAQQIDEKQKIDKRHPYFHAISALDEMTNNQFKLLDSHDFNANLDSILDKVESGYEIETSEVVFAGPMLPGDDSLFYEPSTTSVAGVLSLREFYGPPGWGENPETDDKEQQWLLELFAPIDVYPTREGDEINTTETGVTELTLALSGTYIDPKWDGDTVMIVGGLFHAHTAYHHTEVLMAIKELTH